jgi:hypothetical protein
VCLFGFFSWADFWLLLCILPMYLGTACAFLIKLFLLIKKKTFDPYRLGQF